MFSAAGKFVRHVAPGIVRPLHVLWNEVIGFIFFALAVLVLVGTVRRTANDPQSFWLLVLGVAFGLVLAGFGLNSFLRARKISRS